MCDNYKNLYHKQHVKHNISTGQFFCGGLAVDEVRKLLFMPNKALVLAILYMCVHGLEA